MIKNKLFQSILLISAIVLVMNFISGEFFLRLDLTEGKQYTLSQSTKDILKNLDRPISVKVYFSEGLRPDFDKGRTDLKEMLMEYNSLSRGMLVYEFVNPNEKSEFEQDAMQDGISPLMINIVEKDEQVQKKAYMGAVINLGTQKEIIPFIQPGGAIEYEFSKAIKKISVTEKPTIGLLQGHGEPGIHEMSQAYQELSILYNFEPLSLNDSTLIPERFKTIAIVRPTDSIPYSHLAQLDQFMARGGALFACINRVDFDMQMGYGMDKNTGIESWLLQKGVMVNNNFVLDANAASIQVPQQMGPIQVYAQVTFPYAPIIKTFADHPSVKGLEAVILQFVSSISYVGDSSKKFIPIAYTSEKSATAMSPLYINIEKQWTNADFPQKGLVVAAALQSDNTRMIVVGDGDFCINGAAGQGQQPRQLNPDNVNMFVNAIDWLSDDTGLIELRTKSITARPIKEVEEGKKEFLKYLNFLLPILLVIGYGIYRMQERKNIRIKRMEEDYGR